MYTLQKGRIRKTEMKPNTATPMETSSNTNGLMARLAACGPVGRGCGCGCAG